MNIEIGSYEAKTRLPELLRGIQAGKRYTITLRGAAVAALVPPETVRGRNASDAVARMLHLVDDAQPLSGTTLRALIDEGRA